MTTDTVHIHRLLPGFPVPDPRGFRAGLERVCADQDLRPPGFPDVAILVVRRLEAPPIGPEWTTGLRERLGVVARRAGRPASGWVEPSVEAVLFADEAELLAALLLDAAEGRAPWWWVSLFGRSPSAAVGEALRTRPRVVPAALSRLGSPDQPWAALPVISRGLPEPAAVLYPMLSAWGLQPLAPALASASAPALARALGESSPPPTPPDVLRLLLVARLLYARAAAAPRTLERALERVARPAEPTATAGWEQALIAQDGSQQTHGAGQPPAPPQRPGRPTVPTMTWELIQEQLTPQEPPTAQTPVAAPPPAPTFVSQPAAPHPAAARLAGREAGAPEDLRPVQIVQDRPHDLATPGRAPPQSTTDVLAGAAQQRPVEATRSGPSSSAPTEEPRASSPAPSHPPSLQPPSHLPNLEELPADPAQADPATPQQQDAALVGTPARAPYSDRTGRESPRATPKTGPEAAAPWTETAPDWPVEQPERQTRDVDPASEATPALAAAPTQASSEVPVPGEPAPSWTPSPALSSPAEADASPVIQATPAPHAELTRPDPAIPAPSDSERVSWPELPSTSRRPTAPTPAIQPPPPHESLTSRYAGLLFLLVVLQDLELYPDFTRPLDLGFPVPAPAMVLEVATALLGALPQDLLVEQLRAWAEPDAPRAALPPGFVAPERARRFFGRPSAWIVASDGPWVQVIHPGGALVAEVPSDGRDPRAIAAGLGLSPVLRGDPFHLPGELRARVAARVARHAVDRLVAVGVPAPEAPALLLCRAGYVEWTDTRLDAHFSLEDHPIALRLALLDRDPGWIPGTGRTLRFHFT